MNFVYLDNHATTRVDPRVVTAMRPFLDDCYGNPASAQHHYGQQALEAVEAARSELASMLNVLDSEICFTSGATESNNLAIKGYLEANPEIRTVVTSPTEHKSVLESMKWAGQRGIRVIITPVDSDGVVDVDAIQKATAQGKSLVSVMAANNEVGTIAPLVEIGAICRQNGATFHCDAAQAFGKIPLIAEEIGVDLLSISAHKLHGAKGIGALFCRRLPPVQIAPQMLGGGQERGLRSGTVNVAGCVGFGEAARLMKAEGASEQARCRALRDDLLAMLRHRIPGLLVNGHPVDRLAGNLNVSLADCDVEDLMLAIPDVAIGSGSACSSSGEEPSHVLLAIGRSHHEAQNSLRFGIGRFNSAADVSYAGSRVIEGYESVRTLVGRIGERGTLEPAIAS